MKFFWNYYYYSFRAYSTSEQCPRFEITKITKNILTLSIIIKLSTVEGVDPNKLDVNHASSRKLKVITVMEKEKAKKKETQSNVYTILKEILAEEI